jgi:hypothetical protein
VLRRGVEVLGEGKEGLTARLAEVVLEVVLEGGVAVAMLTAAGAGAGARGRATSTTPGTALQLAVVVVAVVVAEGEVMAAVVVVVGRVTPRGVRSMVEAAPVVVGVDMVGVPGLAGDVAGVLPALEPAWSGEWTHDRVIAAA